MTDDKYLHLSVSVLFERYVKARDLALNGLERYYHLGGHTGGGMKAHAQYERRADEADELAEAIRAKLSK